MRDKRGAHKVLVGKPTEKRPHEKLRRRRKDNTKNGSSTSGMGSHGLNYSGSGWGQAVGASEFSNGLPSSIK